MNKIILYIFVIFLLVNSTNAMELPIEELDSEKNQDKLFPAEIWQEIALKLIDIKQLEEAKTLPMLETAIKGIFEFSLLTKKHNIIVSYLVNKEFEFNGKKIKLKDLYIQRKNEILGEIKQKLKTKFPTESFSWFNDINAKGPDGWTALTYVSDKDCKELAELLIINGADINIEDNDGWTALMIAALDNNKEIVKLLIHNGADINSKDKSDWTALICAAYKGHIEIAEILLQAEADIDTKDKYDRPASLIADIRNHKNVVELINKYKRT